MIAPESPSEYEFPERTSCCFEMFTLLRQEGPTISEVWQRARDRASMWWRGTCPAKDSSAPFNMALVVLQSWCSVTVFECKIGNIRSPSKCSLAGRVARPLPTPPIAQFGQLCGRPPCPQPVGSLTNPICPLSGSWSQRCLSSSVLVLTVRDTKSPTGCRYALGSDACCTCELT